jgi:hypothetical protein
MIRSATRRWGAFGAGGVIACIAVTPARSWPMLLYNRTNAADAILRDGFRDEVGSYISDVILRGVWLSAVPLGTEEGARGNQVLEVDFPEALAIEHEVVRKGRPWPPIRIVAGILWRRANAVDG